MSGQQYHIRYYSFLIPRNHVFFSKFRSIWSQKAAFESMEQKQEMYINIQKDAGNEVYHLHDYALIELVYRQCNGLQNHRLALKSLIRMLRDCGSEQQSHQVNFMVPYLAIVQIVNSRQTLIKCLEFTLLTEREPSSRLLLFCLKDVIILLSPRNARIHQRNRDNATELLSTSLSSTIRPSRALTGGFTDIHRYFYACGLGQLPEAIYFNEFTRCFLADNLLYAGGDEDEVLKAPFPLVCTSAQSNYPTVSNKLLRTISAGFHFKNTSRRDRQSSVPGMTASLKPLLSKETLPTRSGTKKSVRPEKGGSRPRKKSSRSPKKAVPTNAQPMPGMEHRRQRKRKEKSKMPVVRSPPSQSNQGTFDDVSSLEDLSLLVPSELMMPLNSIE